MNGPSIEFPSWNLGRISVSEFPKRWTGKEHTACGHRWWARRKLKMEAFPWKRFEKMVFGGKGH